MLYLDVSIEQVVQLREQLRARGLSASGTKSELIERLKESLTNEEKILEGDDSVSKENTETSVAADSSVKNESLSSERSLKKSALEGGVSKEGQKAVVKEKSTVEKEIENKDAEDTLDAKVKRAVRFGLPLSDEELKRKRAERFGLNAGVNEGGASSEDEKKRRRLERFGPVDGATKNSASVLDTEEVLRKRAERFGLPLKGKDTSIKQSSIGGVEKASLEALEKRAKRFGVCSEQAEAEIKKLRRAERFGVNKS
uniref:SAP domain-containing protein n=1 Tax=Parascaris univalens TaxID=6257 RepID=A0A915C2N7_PARUN